MSGGGSVRIETAEDKIRDQKIIENNDALKQLIIELRIVLEYLKAIIGEKL